MGEEERDGEREREGDGKNERRGLERNKSVGEIELGTEMERVR